VRGQKGEISNEGNVPVKVRLPNPLVEKLDQIAEKAFTNRSEIVRRAVIDHITKAAA
jgi:metal-responsive CopG/Arc/MetJ family transcriptional regulator